MELHCCMLRAFGFAKHYIRLILACISIVSYRIKLNGHVGEKFQPSRGIRQGDPISPYLFILAVEGLSMLLHSVVHNGRLSGVKLSNSGPTISHFMFGDDFMILTEAKIDEVYILLDIVNSYSLASSQRINVAKSELLFSKDVNEGIRSDISRIMGMPIADSPSKYLGLPGDWHGSKTQALTWLKDGVWNKIQGWKEHYLSQAGNEILIKSVIQAIPTYIISVFVIPKTFCNKLLSLMARFWWRSARIDRGIN